MVGPEILPTSERSTAAVPPDAPVAPEVDAQVRELLKRPYRMVVRGDPERGYLAEAPELPNCFTAGDTPEEALAMLQDAMYAWLLVHVEEGLPIPEPAPESDEYSGRFNLRLPKSLHRDLARRAEQEGVSLNTLVVMLLSRGLGDRAAAA